MLTSNLRWLSVDSSKRPIFKILVFIAAIYSLDHLWNLYSHSESKADNQKNGAVTTDPRLAPGIGFDLTTSYATAAIRFYNGSIKDAGKVAASEDFHNMMLRLSTGPEYAWYDYSLC